MVDLTQYHSHPDKQLLVHTRGVVGRVQSLTNLKIAEVAAIFHDVGKLNPNFQRKLYAPKVDGYSNHAYLSAFSFLCYCAANQEAILKIFNNEKEWLGSILAIIAHHHGDLPDFPIILTGNEYSSLLSFLKENPELPMSELVESFISHNNFSVLNHQLKDDFQSRIQIQLTRQISKPLDFFLETQFAFSSLIAADKADASHYQNNDSIQVFCSQYHDKLNTYLKKLSTNSELNKIRTQMREKANKKVKEELLKGVKVFSLTAPTGSGKTMMLLSLAGEILKHQNNLRIIYALPYLSITEQEFNRYCLERLPNPIEIKELASMIESEEDSVLVILNTIQDTKDLFRELSEWSVDAKLILLNTHFSPNDRKAKIEQSAELLEQGKRVILISTQLVEAGVDIDFPVVYRDFCPVPSIVQSAGRCNRNGEHTEKGRIIIFNLQKNGISRSTLIYRGKDSRFLNFVKDKIQALTLQETEVLTVQQSFFDDIQTNTLFGVHYGKQFKEEEIDFIQRLKEVAFSEIGKFKLIDEREFGEEYRYYVLKSDNDSAFEQLENLHAELKEINFSDFEKRKFKYIQIENHLKKMTGNVVQVRLRQMDVKPIACSENCCGLLKLLKGGYNSITGIQLSTENQFL